MLKVHNPQELDKLYFNLLDVYTNPDFFKQVPKDTIFGKSLFDMLNHIKENNLNPKDIWFKSDFFSFLDSNTNLTDAITAVNESNNPVKGLVALNIKEIERQLLEKSFVFLQEKPFPIVLVLMQTSAWTIFLDFLMWIRTALDIPDSPISQTEMEWWLSMVNSCLDSVTTSLHSMLSGFTPEMLTENVVPYMKTADDLKKRLQEQQKQNVSTKVASNGKIH